MKQLLAEKEQLFPLELPKGLPPLREGGHSVIPLHPGPRPQNRAMFRYSPLERREMETQVAELLEKGLIQPSISPYGAPVLFVKKKTGELRMCIDYRALNTSTVRNSYPLPRIDDLLDKLQGATVFSSLDLMSGYHQIRLPPEDEPKTAFKTPFGLFQFKVMPFGLTNAPAIFMSHMNQTLRGLSFVVVYLDDILIFSKTREEHVDHVKQVLDRLQQQKFYIKLSKCDFFKDSLKFLGFIISAQGVQVDPSKTMAVKDWPIPTTVHDVRAFLGLTNHFRKFIQGYSQICLPLTDLTKGAVSKHKGKTKKVEWTEKCTTAFQLLKEKLCNAPLLVLADFTKPFTVITDASDYAMGAILEQEGRPVAFESKKFNNAECNYSATDRELLAVKIALETWRCYLEGSTFEVHTDHNPLTYLQTQKTLSRRQARWSEFFQGFDFKWVYKPGANNPADPLSRLVSLEEEPLEGGMTGACLSVVNTVRAPPLPMVKRQRSYPDPYVGCLEGYRTDPWFRKPKNLIQLQKENDLYYHQDRLVVPAIPALRRGLIRSVHDTPMAGHPGRQRTLINLQKHFWWPKMHKDVKNYVQTCRSCQEVKAARTKTQGLLMPLPIPETKWHTVTMDFITELPLTPKNHNAILVFTDKLTKMIHLVPTHNTHTAKTCAEYLRDHIFKLHGLPRVLISDRDPLFRADLYQEIVRYYDIKHGFSTAYRPQTDGQTERVNQVVEDYLRHYTSDCMTDWDEHLAMAEFAHNNSLHSATGSTPFLLNYGVEPLTPASFLSPEQQLSKNFHFKSPAALSFTERMDLQLKQAKKFLQAAQQRDKAYADKKRKPIEFKEGEQVLLSTKNLRLHEGGSRKLLRRFIGPFTIAAKINDNAFKLHLPSDLKCHDVFNVCYLRKYYGRPGDSAPSKPVQVDGAAEWYINKIVEERTVSAGRGRPRTKQYLVSWKGYSSDYDTWEPAHLLENTKALDKYLARQG